MFLLKVSRNNTASLFFTYHLQNGWNHPLQEISKDEYEMKMMQATSGKQFKLSWDVKAHQRSLGQLWTAINNRIIFIYQKY